MDTRNGVVMRDPDELHDFALFLCRERELINELINQLQYNMNVMNETWRDKQNKQFVDSFQPHTESIARLSEHLEQHEQFVEMKARQIDDYNRTVYFD